MRRRCIMADREEFRLPKPEPCGTPDIRTLKKSGDACEAEFYTLPERLVLKLPPETYERLQQALADNPNLKVSFAADKKSYSASMIDPRCGNTSREVGSLDFDEQGRVDICCELEASSTGKKKERFIVVLPSPRLLEAVRCWYEDGGGVAITSSAEEDPRTASMVDVRCAGARWTGHRTASQIDPRCGGGGN